MAKFAPLAAAGCLYTTLRNIGDKAAFFGFLPPHGRKLDVGEEITIFGEIGAYFARMTYHGRHQRAFENALAGDNPVMAIAKTPAVHLFDHVLDLTKIIDLDNGSLITKDACWGHYHSTFLS